MPTRPSAVETHLHGAFAEWNLRGEWFERAKLSALATTAGAWEPLLRHHLPGGEWQITVFADEAEALQDGLQPHDPLAQ